METIQGDIIPLAGKSRLSILQTFTPIYPDDVVQKIREDPNWTTTVYPAIISMPTNTELWNEYFKMYNEESVAEAGHAASRSCTGASTCCPGSSSPGSSSSSREEVKKLFYAKSYCHQEEYNTF